MKNKFSIGDSEKSRILSLHESVKKNHGTSLYNENLLTEKKETVNKPLIQESKPQKNIKKIVRLSENELVDIIGKILNEQRKGRGGQLTGSRNRPKGDDLTIPNWKGRFNGKVKFGGDIEKQAIAQNVISEGTDLTVATELSKMSNIRQETEFITPKPIIVNTSQNFDLDSPKLTDDAKRTIDNDLRSTIPQGQEEEYYNFLKGKTIIVKAFSSRDSDPNAIENGNYGPCRKEGTTKAEYNQCLSQKRAENVVTYLKKLDFLKGVKFDPQGMGETCDSGNCWKKKGDKIDPKDTQFDRRFEIEFPKYQGESESITTGGQDDVIKKVNITIGVDGKTKKVQGFKINGQPAVTTQVLKDIGIQDDFGNKSYITKIGRKNGQLTVDGRNCGVPSDEPTSEKFSSEMLRKTPYKYWSPLTTYYDSVEKVIDGKETKLYLLKDYYFALAR